MSDFIADFLTVIRNASQAKHEKVTISTSNLTAKIAEILKREGFIDNYRMIEEGNKRYIRLHLRYIGKDPAIRSIQRLSKPGRRMYAGYKDLPRVQGGLGIAIISTSRGLVTDKDARRDKLGGELICTVS